MKFTEKSRQKLRSFLRNQDNRGHASRVTETDIDENFKACWVSAEILATDIMSTVETNLSSLRILEIGCSIGLICFAIKKLYPESEVIGLECEKEAIDVAMALRSVEQSEMPIFIEGYAENIPLEDNSVDLIICHTVIEHVRSVEQVIAEMARVLSPTGAIHLEAPNYIFPYEPHLEIFTIPKLGASFMKFSALLQGKWHQRDFINHLQLVDPNMLESYFNRFSLEWDNRAITKLLAVTTGLTTVKKYHRIAKLLKILHSVGVASVLVRVIVLARLYPSVSYTLNKKSID